MNTGLEEIFTLNNLLHLARLAGGLFIFLYGMDMLSEASLKSAGNTLKLILEKATGNPIIGILVGTLVTGLIQSSSATTSLLVSLVQTQLMTFERSVPVILGANIGTTITTQILAFNISQWALGIIALGYLIKIAVKRTYSKNIAHIVLGLGLMFLGFGIMSHAMRIFREYPDILETLNGFENITWGILVAAIITAVIQSSSASIGIIQALAMQSLITIEAAVPLILGANIGTCINAIISAINTNAAAKRVAASHLLFNIVSVTICAFFVPQFIKLIYSISPAEDLPRLIANAQTSFNVIGTILWLPFLKQLQALSKLVVADDKFPAKAQYFFPRASAMSNSPELLFIQSSNAMKQYKNIVKDMLWLSRDYFIDRDNNKVKELIELREYQREFRIELLDFLGRILKLKLPYKDIAHCLNQISLVNEIEHIAYKLEAAVENLHSESPHFDDSYIGIGDYFKQSVKSFSKACNSVLNNSPEEAQKIISLIEENKEQEKLLLNYSIEHIHNDTDYEKEKLNLWVLEFLRSLNATSNRIAQITVTVPIKKLRRD